MTTKIKRLALKRSVFFTLLEILVAFALIASAGGLVALKMSQAVKKKKFESNLSRLKTRFEICRKLAIGMQSDWKGTLIQDKNECVFELECLDSPVQKKFPKMVLESLVFHFDGAKVERLSIEFFSSGEVFPHGVLHFSQGAKLDQDWKLPEIFQMDNSIINRKYRPAHPEGI